MASQDDNPPFRWEEIKRIWNEFPWLWFIPGAIVGLVVGYAWGYRNAFGLPGWFIDAFWPEALGIVFTVGVLEVIQRRREKKRQDAIHRALSWNLGKRTTPPESHHVFYEMVVRSLLSGYEMSYFNIQGFEIKKFAIKKAALTYCNLSETKWTNGNLAGTWLGIVFLQKAKFFECTMDTVVIDRCSLSDGGLYNVSMRNARVKSCLIGADLKDTDLRNSDLSGSSLRSALLMDVDLCGVNLEKVNLKSARFVRVRCDSSTILPDGSFYDPELGDGQFDRFRNEDHSDFFPVSEVYYIFDDVPGYYQVDDVFFE